MIRFLHSVENVIFLDGDDTRRAPMAAALFRRFASRDPLLSLWHTEVSSAGSGKFTVAGASPDEMTQQAMLSLGLDISSHSARRLTEPRVGASSIVLGIDRKHVEYACNHVCDSYPTYRNRIITFFDYLYAPDMKFDSLIGSAKLSDYVNFANWVESFYSRLVYRFREDTYLPLLAKGKGLGSAVVRGPARIGTNNSDAQDIQEGDVVVCGTMNLIQAYGRGNVEKAAAIITDSVGEMAQLSQLSHELKIPCVGGTRYGTQVLHNEQLLVDATGGLVYGINHEAGEYDT